MPRQTNKTTSNMREAKSTKLVGRLKKPTILVLLLVLAIVGVVAYYGGATV